MSKANELYPEYGIVVTPKLLGGYPLQHLLAVDLSVSSDRVTQPLGRLAFVQNYKKISADEIIRWIERTVLKI